MEGKSVIIIGAGLGGLMCGYILSKEGYKVTILEKNGRVGGAIQSFGREGVTFNTGFNYTESLGEGEVLNRYFSYFNIMSRVKFKKLDQDGFDRVSFSGNPKQYKFAMGQHNFIDTLSKEFPEEREAIEFYFKTIETVANSFPMYNLDESNSSCDIITTMEQGLQEFLELVTSNKKLQGLLAGTNLLYAGVKDKTPLYLHALINYSFIKSAWRIVGGGSKIATILKADIIDMGGEVHRNKRVERVVEDSLKKGELTVECEDDSSYIASHVISNIHPASTLKLIDSKVRKAYSRRVEQLDNTIGMFTIYVVLKPNSFRYKNYNIHHYKSDNVWTTNYREWPENFMLYTPADRDGGEYAKGVEILTFMKYSEVQQWSNSSVEQRGEEYEQFKIDRAEKLLDLVEERIPSFRNSIKSYYTSTPLTYRNYTGTVNGASFGIEKDYNHPLKCMINPQSPIPNILFTGQNLNMHGILGVTIGAFDTCSKLLGTEYLLNRVKNG